MKLPYGTLGVVLFFRCSIFRTPVLFDLRMVSACVWPALDKALKELKTSN